MVAMETTRHFCDGSISENVQGPKLYNCAKFHAFMKKVNISPQILHIYHVYHTCCVVPICYYLFTYLFVIFFKVTLSFGKALYKYINIQCRACQKSQL